MSDRFFNRILLKLFGEREEKEKLGSYMVNRARMHSQNLNERGYRDENGKYHELPEGPMWRHGRAWFYLEPKDTADFHDGQRRQTEMTLDWMFGSPVRGVSAYFDGVPYGDAPRWLLHVTVPWLFSLYWSISTPWIRWRASQPGKFGFGMASDSDFLQLFWNFNDEHMDSSRETGWRKSWFLNDVFFGRTTMHEQVIDTRPVVVHMPEGGYRATCKLTLSTWTRPRWPGKVWHQRKGASLDMDEGQQIPIPGKGENSWDCDDDALFGLSTSAETVEEAIAKMRTSALTTRNKRASAYWKPRDGWKAAHPI
jgi:hypothetical protein